VGQIRLQIMRQSGSDFAANQQKRYGIGTLKTRNRNLLLIVKNKRNAIAHGEQSFKEACREMTINDIEKLIKATFVALDDIIQQVNDYFSQKKYML
jgi:hypothetical protein